MEKEKIVLKVSNEEISKKIPEESFLESLPLSYSSLSEKEISILKLLEKRKDIVRSKEEKEISVEITELGEKLINSDRPLAVWREYRGMTQKELETASGIAQGYIAQIEKGTKKGGVDTLKKLAEPLNITIDDLT